MGSKWEFGPPWKLNPTKGGGILTLERTKPFPWQNKGYKLPTFWPGKSGGRAIKSPFIGAQKAKTLAGGVFPGAPTRGRIISPPQWRASLTYTGVSYRGLKSPPLWRRDL